VAISQYRSAAFFEVWLASRYSRILALRLLVPPNDPANKEEDKREIQCQTQQGRNPVDRRAQQRQESNDAGNRDLAVAQGAKPRGSAKKPSVTTPGRPGR
jgi:hypothetical protein